MDTVAAVGMRDTERDTMMGIVVMYQVGRKDTAKGTVAGTIDQQKGTMADTVEQRTAVVADSTAHIDPAPMMLMRVSVAVVPVKVVDRWVVAGRKCQVVDVEAAQWEDTMTESSQLLDRDNSVEAADRVAAAGDRTVSGAPLAGVCRIRGTLAHFGVDVAHLGRCTLGKQRCHRCGCEPSLHAHVVAYRMSLARRCSVHRRSQQQLVVVPATELEVGR